MTVACRGLGGRRSEQNRLRTEPFAAAGDPFPEPASGCGRRAGSAQNEIDQRDQRRQNTSRDQGIVGANAGVGFERMVGLPGHLAILGRADRPFCEVGHSLQYSFRFGREERIGSVGIDRERGVFGAVQAGDRRWANDFSQGDRETARNYGCRCSSTPWNRSRGRIFVPSAATNRYWLR